MPSERPRPKGICVRIGFAPMTFSGDIAGTELFATSNWASPGPGRGIVGTFVFTPDSTIASCGAGAFVVQFGPTPKGTPSPSGGPDRPAFWRIVSTSGSSPLATTTGEGLIWAEPVAGSASITAHLTGTVQC